MDIFIKENRKYIIAGSIALIGCILMISFPDLAVLSAQKGIAIWLTDILPAMLPFFICVNFLTVTGVTGFLPKSVFPFIMSVLSGYPIGAKIVGDMKRCGSINKQEAMRLLSFCSTSGPVFIIGAVGVGMIGSREAGLIIAVAHYLGAICNGILFSAFYTKQKHNDIGEIHIHSGELADKLTEAIFAAFKSLAVILAYIIFFMLITDLLDYFGLFHMIPSDSGKAYARGIFEMTVGCSSLANIDASLLCKCIIASAIISWGGLSVIGQSVSMISGTDISALYIVITKFSHSFFAGIIALFIGSIML